MHRIIRLMDLPPIWLIGFLALTWATDQMLPWGMFGPSARLAGGLLALLGVGLMVAGVVQMVRARTTIVPRETPAALVTGGIFRFSRNPIYLGDALVLAGVVLWWDVPLAAPLVLLFILVIQTRFILAEEAVLRATFGPAFDAWAARTRRWI